MYFKEDGNLWGDFVFNGADESKELGIGKNRHEFCQSTPKSNPKEILTKRFSRIEEYFGPDWDKLSRDYFAHYPPKQFEVKLIGENFAKFIKESSEMMRYEDFLHELATYELKVFSTYLSPQRNFTPSALVLRVNKTFSLHLFEYEIVGWICQCEDEGRKLSGTPDKSSNMISFSRSLKANICVVTYVDDIDILLIEILKAKELSLDDLIKELWKMDKNLKKYGKEVLTIKINNLVKQEVFY